MVQWSVPFMVMNGTVTGGAVETPIGGRCLLFEVKLVTSAARWNRRD
jgi:hypothetical protein